MINPPIFNVTDFSLGRGNSNVSDVTTGKKSGFYKIMSESTSKRQENTQADKKPGNMLILYTESNVLNNDSNIETSKSDFVNSTNPLEESIIDTIILEEMPTQESISEISNTIKNILLKNLGISEEELIASMETMGITYLDLQNREILTEFISQFYQISDSFELVTDPNAYNSLKSIMEDIKINIGEATHEEFFYDHDTVLVENVMAQTWDEDVTELFEKEAQQIEASEIGDKHFLQSDQKVEQEKGQTEASSDGMKQIHNPTDEKYGQGYQDSESEKQDNEEPSQGSNSQSKDFMKNVILTKETGTDKKFETGIQALQSISNKESSQPQIQLDTPNVVSYLENMYEDQPDIDSIANQLIDKIKFTVTPEIKQLEIQLQPENLGKIDIQLTAKGGTVAAHIITQNEMVKEAVESQISQLKEQFIQQGIQIKEVQVSVSSQSYDENLWQGRQEQRDDQGNKNNHGTRHKRNLQVNFLESNEDLLNEEELLEAEIMRQNGTSVSYLA